MALSNPASRKLMHTREIRCQGYLRDDGLWDIEGRIVDTKAYSFESDERGTVGAGNPVHDMTVRITVDDDGLVHAAEAVSETTPFAMCPAVAPDYSRLKGLTVGPGWRKGVMERLGGVKGCTHVNDLVMGPLAVTAYQTLHAVRKRRTRAKGQAPRTFNTCHTLSGDSPVARRIWPDLFDKDAAPLVEPPA